MASLERVHQIRHIEAWNISVPNWKLPLPETLETHTKQYRHDDAPEMLLQQLQKNTNTTQKHVSGTHGGITVRHFGEQLIDLSPKRFNSTMCASNVCLVQFVFLSVFPSFYNAIMAMFVSFVFSRVFFAVLRFIGLLFIAAWLHLQHCGASV